MARKNKDVHHNRPNADQHYLSETQYADAANLNARIRLHQRFSTNPYPVHDWFFDQLSLEPESELLELGCGPGRFWVDGMPSPPHAWRVTLSDFSWGMVRDARRVLNSADSPFRFGVLDAQAIPFPDGTFDAVVANNMLYHVPDRGQALAEIKRVLRPDGVLYAMTFGRNHLSELCQWVNEFGLETTLMPPGEWAGAFDLEQGRDELAQYFEDVQVAYYPDSLAITELIPLLDYVCSTATLLPFPDDKWQAFVLFLQEKLRAGGNIAIQKTWGLLTAR